MLSIDEVLHALLLPLVSPGFFVQHSCSRAGKDPAAGLSKAVMLPLLQGPGAEPPPFNLPEHVLS